MAVLPGVLGCRPLRRTVQVRLGTNPAGRVARWHAHLRDLATAIHETSGLAVDIFAVADLDHIDYQILVFDGVDNSVTSLWKTILILAGQFFAPRRSRVFFQIPNALDNPPGILLQRNGLNVLDRRRFNQNFIFCHVFSGLLGRLRKAGLVRAPDPQMRQGPLHLQPAGVAQLH